MEFLTLTPLWWLLLLIPLLGYAWWSSLVDRPPLMKRLAFACRCVAVLCVLLALCRPFWKNESDNVHTVFLIDVSESVDSVGMREAVLQIKEKVSQLTADDSYSQYLYARELKAVTNEQIDRFISDVENGRSDADFRAESDLAQAMLASQIAFPADKARRLVVFSDGVPTSPVDDVIQVLQEEGTSIQLAQITPLSQAEASVVSIESGSPVAFQGEVVRLAVRLYSNKAMKARLRILHRGVSVGEQEIELKEAEETLAHADVEMVTAGNSVWTAELIPVDDHFPLNNQVSTTISVKGKPRVLAIHDDSKKMRGISRALKEQGIELDLRGARGLPDRLEEMLAFDAIMLADVPATELRPRQMEWLKKYVTDFGGGLAMLGSENSFGLGGYFKTPVEEVLPLVSRFEKEKQKPSLAMVLVIDKSGSMSGQPIVLARQAARAAAELLSGRDYIGVVGFDSNPQIVCDLTSAGNRNQVADSIDSLQASGGTDLYPAMVAARDMLASAPAKIKHVICMTDGQTSESNLLALTQEMADAGMTVSSVALGEGSARALLSSIAETGKGRYYETDDPANVPQIFTRETMQASKSAIKEDLFASVQLTDHPLMSGFEKADLPFILGYVMTRPKATAQVLLVAETGDPLLAVSRFGLGNGLAWTSDLTEKWGSEWLSWSGGGKFWAQVLRGILRKDTGTGISLQKSHADEVLSLTVKRSDEAGRLLNNVPWEIEALDEYGKSVDVAVQETGLGSYKLSLPTAGKQRLALRLLDPQTGALKVTQWTRAYPAEYQLNSSIPAALADLSVESTDVNPVTIRTSATPLFGLLAILFTIAGIVMRRV